MDHAPTPLPDTDEPLILVKPADEITAFGATVLVVHLVAFLAACPPPSPQTILTDVDVVCDRLETQPEPAFVYLACDLVDVAGGDNVVDAGASSSSRPTAVVSSFQCKVPRANADAFLAHHRRRAVDAGAPPATSLSLAVTDAGKE